MLRVSPLTPRRGRRSELVQLGLEAMVKRWTTISPQQTIPQQGLPSILTRQALKLAEGPVSPLQIPKLPPSASACRRPH